MMDNKLIIYATNKELIHRLKYCRTRGKDMIVQLKELIAVTDRIKDELRMRMVDLETEIKLAESDRLNSEDPFFSALLELH